MTRATEIRTFRDLDVWKLAMDMVVETYDAATKLPGSEQYGLSSQIRKSAVSIPSNIAEGHTRRGRAYWNHVRIALGSNAELDTQLEIAVRLRLLSANDIATLTEINVRVGQMLYRLSESLKREQWVVGSGFALLICVGCATLMRIFG